MVAQKKSLSKFEILFTDLQKCKLLIKKTSLVTRPKCAEIFASTQRC